jgi:hypothetical protein
MNEKGRTKKRKKKNSFSDVSKKSENVCEIGFGLIFMSIGLDIIKDDCIFTPYTSKRTMGRCILLC